MEGVFNHTIQENGIIGASPGTGFFAVKVPKNGSALNIQEHQKYILRIEELVSIKKAPSHSLRPPWDSLGSQEDPYEEIREYTVVVNSFDVHTNNKTGWVWLYD